MSLVWATGFSNRPADCRFAVESAPARRRHRHACGMRDRTVRPDLVRRDAHGGLVRGVRRARHRAVASERRWMIFLLSRVRLAVIAELVTAEWATFTRPPAVGQGHQRQPERAPGQAGRRRLRHGTEAVRAPAPADSIPIGGGGSRCTAPARGGLAGVDRVAGLSGARYMLKRTSARTVRRRMSPKMCC